jgi:hypothetical protein
MSSWDTFAICIMLFAVATNIGVLVSRVKDLTEVIKKAVDSK